MYQNYPPPLTTTTPQLYGIVGSVGSGKSSLLSAILGEMECESGKVSLPYKPPSSDPSSSPGYVAYASQTPWVVNDTLRGNVTFGRPYDEERYQKVGLGVLFACAC